MSNSMKSHWEVVKSGMVLSPETPEELWEAACSYFQWADENPIIKKRNITAGKQAGTTYNDETPRPYNIKAMCLHCGVLQEYFQEIRESKNTDSMYYVVVSKIMYIIYAQNLELATTGVYNSIFVGKMLGMDKEETPTSAVKVNIIGNLPELATSENEILEKLEAEKSLFGNTKEQNP